MVGQGGREGGARASKLPSRNRGDWPMDDGRHCAKCCDACMPRGRRGVMRCAAHRGLAAATATRNGTLGGAYFILAARAVGLDCGPMSGVDLAKVNAEFFPDGRYVANFLINLGYADHGKEFARNARLSFEQACTVL